MPQMIVIMQDSAPITPTQYMLVGTGPQLTVVNVTLASDMTNEPVAFVAPPSTFDAAASGIYNASHCSAAIGVSSLAFTELQNWLLNPTGFQISLGLAGGTSKRVVSCQFSAI